jgi:hypothetical protein
MKLATCLFATAILAIPAAAVAQTTRTPVTGPGQSEFAPGHQPGPAKKSAPGQRMHKQDVKGQPGASEYAPGHQPTAATTTTRKK